MANAGTISVDVQARISDFTQQLRQAESRASSFAAHLSKMGKADYLAPMQETLKGMRRDFKQIIQGIVLAQTFYQGIQLFKQLAAAVYEYTDALDYAKVTFSNLFRDASLGEEFVYVLQQYAARSPFDFTDIEKGARQLAAYGIQARNLMFVMQGIGNLSAVTGDPQTFDSVSRAIGQIYAKGKLSAEEMRQLAEAGLNVKAVYERLGVTADTVSKAHIDAATAINAIIDVLNTNYAGAMNAANTTMRGMMGNVKDVLLSTVSAVYEPSYKRMQRILLGFQQQIDRFQQTFTAKGLKEAIAESFGDEVLVRLQQFVAICQMLGNTLYQALVPVFRILGMYGKALVTVFGLLGQILIPVIRFFSALLNTILQNAQATKLLYAALMGLAIIKVVGGLAKILQGALGLVTKQLATMIQTLVVARQSMAVFSFSMKEGATASVAAGNAYRYFTASLKTNPLILILSLVLSLITAFLGLRSILGMTSDSLSSFEGIDTSKIFDGIKMGTGDLEKFNNRLEDTGTGVDDLNDDLATTKKRQKDLLSFDEVFRLPETESTSSPTADAIDDLANASWPDVGAFELPTLEPLDWRSLLPDINSIFDWFKNQPWERIASAAGNGIIAGFAKPWEGFWKKFKESPKEAFKSMEKSTAKSLESSALGELLKSVKSGKGLKGFKADELFKAFTTSIKNAFTPAKIANFLKTGAKDFGLTLIGEFLFDQLAKWLKEHGYTEASIFASNFGSVIASGLATLMVTRNPFAAIGGATFTAIINSLAKGLREGDWTSFEVSLTGGLSFALSRLGAHFPELFKTIFPKAIKGGGFLGIGSIITDLLFGSIEESMLANGDVFGAEVIGTVGDSLSGALAGAGIGMLLGPAGAIAGAIIGAIVGGLSGHWQEISAWWTNTAVPWFKALPGKIKEFFVNAGSWLKEHGGNLIRGMYNGITSAWSTIGNWFKALPGNVRSFFGNVGSWIKEHGGNLIQGLKNGIVNKWNDIVAWFRAIPTRIKNFFAGAKDWIFEAGKNILKGFKDGILKKWEDIKNWFGGVGQWIKDHKGPASYDKTLLVSNGQLIMSGLQSGLSTGFSRVQSFVGTMGAGMQRQFPNATSLLSNIGTKIMSGLSSALGQTAPVLRAVSNISNYITRSFSGASNLLYSAGWNIMVGLYNGMLDFFYQYTLPQVQNMANIIRANKGPEEYDKKLLVQNGEWIIEGLQNGLLSQFANVLQAVRSFGPQMETAFATPSLSLSRADVPDISSSLPTIGRSILEQSAAAPQTESVANPFLTPSASSSEDISQRPILYVGTLVADKQGLRELQKKLDIVKTERGRYVK